MPGRSVSPLVAGSQAGHDVEKGIHMSKLCMVAVLATAVSMIDRKHIP